MKTLHRFHRRMTFLYTVTTGLILTLVLAAILLYSEKLLSARNSERFQSDILTLVSRLQAQESLSQSWLSQLETDHDLIIHIEDNQIPLLFQGAWTPATDRDFLIREAREHAAGLGVDTAVRPMSSGIRRSDIFQVQGEHRDRYQAIAVNLPYPGGYKSLVLLSSLYPLGETFFRQRIFFLILDISGILALYCVSWKFVLKSLRPIQEMKEQQDSFIAAASHELRSPIAVIQASAGAIAAAPDEVPRLSANIMSECRRLSRLVEDLLNTASAEAASWTAEMKSVDPDTLLLDIYELYETVCHEKKIPLSLDLPDEPLPAVQGDRERLLQLLAVLLDNAVSHSAPDGAGTPICIAARRTHRHILISVIDHGTGIPNEQKDLVFERFYRADHSRKDKTHFGLGLCIAAELAKLHGGSLNVSDTEEGGSTFTLKLPAA